MTLFLEAYKTPPEEIILDIDATDDPLHGHQEGRSSPEATIQGNFIVEDRWKT